ncbi:hypothetical protein [Microbacterium foliorum]|uniref:hypothetical protein n=1 Tax=Microbacterium foliorum TaxID=104336 RepID=UPI0009A04057|nr:hypothetical protein [Microbacterium foliorum]AQY02270.1 hypothetical protein B2G67_12945 [Microbacterium foliorum]
MTDTAPETTSERRLRREIGRRFVRAPFAWGLLFLIAAMVWTIAGDDLSFFPFLLMLLGGWSVAFSFVNATMEMRPVRTGVAVHLGVAVGLTAGMILVIESDDALLAGLPDPVSAVVVVLQIAAGPAAGWIWLGLLSRLTDLIGRRDAKRRPPPAAPEWEREEGRDGSGVEFTALDLRMRTLTLAIVGVVLAVGLAGTALLIAFDDAVMRVGPRLAIILVGVLVGLPVYLLLRGALRRRTLSCGFAFGNDELRIRAGTATHRIPFRHLQHLVWRTRSDYARIEVRGAGVDLSLIAGLAAPSPGRTGELPALPRRVFRRLELAGMRVERSRRDEVVTFRRV